MATAPEELAPLAAAGLALAEERRQIVRHDPVRERLRRVYALPLDAPAP